MPYTASVDDSKSPEQDAAPVGALVSITIPPASECWSERAYEVGGRFRVHPLHSVFADTSRNAVSNADVKWGQARVISVEPKMAVTFHQKKGSFAGLSRKAKCLMSGIGPHEHAKWKDLETDPYVVNYLLQGVRLVWDGHTYTADWVAHHAALGIIAGEVKADRSYFLDPDYAVTMRNASDAFTAASIEFRRETGPEIRGSEQRRKNVARAFRDRFTRFGEAQLDLVRTRLAKGEGTLGELEPQLHQQPKKARSITHAMLCARELAFDLNLPVGPDTIVSAAPVPASVLDIRTIDIAEAA